MFLDDAARNNRQDVQNLANIMLNVRSGAAVSPHEAQRIGRELGTALGQGPEQTRRALQKARNWLAKEFQSMETRQAAPIYQERGGLYTRSNVPGVGAQTKQNQPAPTYEYSASRNQTRITYPDGRVEVKDGRP